CPEDDRRRRIRHVSPDGETGHRGHRPGRPERADPDAGESVDTAAPMNPGVTNAQPQPDAQPDTPVVRMTDVVFGWGDGPPLLRIPALSVAAGERVFISGPSGSGKSTLLALIGGVLTAKSGTVEVLGRSLGELRAARRDALRAEHVGFIFQMFNLLPYLSVLDNVVLPCRFSRRRAARAAADGRSVAEEARRLLGRLGLDDPDLIERE